MVQDVENDHVTLYPAFRASGMKSQHPNINIRRTNGSIQGISVMCRVYDEIDAAGAFPGRASSHEVPIFETFSWPKRWLVDILRLTYHRKQNFEDFGDRLRAVTRSSIAGVGIDRDGRRAMIGDDRFSDAVVLLRNSIQYITQKHVKADVQQFLASEAIKERAKTKTVAGIRLSLEILGKSIGRLPFVTRKGHLVVSSERVKRGDFVALIKGAQVPFILRRQTGGVYQLVSEAYVDGIMDGEAADDTKFATIELV
jgi:hypothetical protein